MTLNRWVLIDDEMLLYFLSTLYSLGARSRVGAATILTFVFTLGMKSGLGLDD